MVKCIETHRRKTIMDNNIILIGPMKAGKSTIGRLLSQKLRIPQYSLNRYRDKYYQEINYDKDLAHRLANDVEGFALYKYWKPFELYSVKRILQDFPRGIIDFGGGQSVYEDLKQFNEVKEILRPYKNVVLLIPSPDKSESKEILNSRIKTEGERLLNEHLIDHHSNYDLAKITIYTKGKSPEETCRDILGSIHLEK
jgi:shikimate kinase